MIAEEHLKEYFLRGFKKDRGGLVNRVEEFVMPSFRLANIQVEEIPAVSNESSDLLKQMSLLMDKKIADAQIVMGDTFATVHSDIAALKKGKNIVDGT